MYYRGIKIRAEIPPEYEYHDIVSVKINFKDKEGSVNRVLNAKKRKTNSFFSWLVYTEGGPIHYSSSAYRLEDVFDEIDRYYAG